MCMYVFGVVCLPLLLLYPQIAAWTSEMQPAGELTIPSVPTVYWPSPCPGEQLPNGYIVGWANGDVAFVVSCIVPVDDVDKTVAALKIIQTSPQMQDFHRYCAGLPCIIGHWTAPGATQQQRNLLSRIRIPAISDQYSCTHPLLIAGPGHLQTAADATPQAPTTVAQCLPLPYTDTIIEEDGVQTPALLAATLSRRSNHVSMLPAVSILATTGILTSESMTIVLYKPPKLLDLDVFSVKPCRQPTVHALGATAVLRSQPEPARMAVDCILSQCNTADYLHNIIKIKSNGDSMSVTHPSLLGRCVRLLVQPLVWLLVALRVVAAVVVALLQRKIPHFIPFIGGFAPYELSTLARQMHLKLWEFCTWPRMLHRLQRMRREVLSGSSWHSPDALFSEASDWYDCVHRALLDMIVGVALCAIFLYTPWAVKLILDSIHTFGEIMHIDVLRAWVDWLMGLPAGLKLNHFAGKKIGGAVLSCIDFWEHITTYLTPIEPAIVVAVGFFGFGGFSLLMAVASDILELATVHLFVLYTQFAWLHHKQMNLLSSLWKLFRGKKQNVLRNRVDSNDYDIAQLLLGTLFFTVVFFLFPTTLVYYAFFLMVWLLILITRAIIWWLITLMNNIPVYTIYCAIFARHHLPTGIYISSEAISTRDTPSNIRLDSTTSIMSRSKFGTSDYLADPAPVVDKAAFRRTHWFALHTVPGGIGIALSPFGEAFSVVMQRYSIGSLLRTFLFGERALGLFRSVGGQQNLRAPTAAQSGVSASGLAFGAHNAAANAPSENAPVVAKADHHVITERFYSEQVSLGSWRDFKSDLDAIADNFCFD